MANNTDKENIIRNRKVLRLSQQDVAESIGLSRTAYRNIEKGDTKLLSENLNKIADALGVNSEELVLGYAPDKDEKGKVRDENSYRCLYEELKVQHRAAMEKADEDMSRLRKEVETLKEYIDMQKDLSRTTDEIIAMLKKMQSRD